MVPETSFSSQLETAPDPRAILNSIGEVVYDWDIATDQIRWGANVCDVLGLADAALLATGKLLAQALAPESPGSRYHAMMASVDKDGGKGSPYQAHYGLLIADRTMRGDGTERLWLEDTGRVFAANDGRPLRAHGIVRVITAWAEMERQSAFHSIFDPLTGLLNRTQICQHIARLCAGIADRQRSFAVLLVGIDGLEKINVQYGYDVADEIIAGLVARLRGNLRAVDVAGRYAGNKFALVMDNCDGEQMQEAGRRMIALMQKDPVASSAGAVQVAIHIGAVLAPRYGRNPQILLQHAGEALEAAGALAAKRYVAFEPSLTQTSAAARRRKTTDDLLHALNDRRIVLAHQPIVRAKTGEVVAHEALLRILDQDGSVAGPSEVLLLAEKAELIGLIDYRIVELAIFQLKEKQAAHLSINISAPTLLDADFPARIKALLALAPGVAQRLMIEISENVTVLDASGTRVAFAALKQLGVKLALDDFGAGHTSLRNLRDLPLDMLKIDGAFVQNLARSPDDRFLVRMLIDLARNLGVATLAQWVEDAETAALLTQWGVDYLQGHHFGRAQVPVAAAESASALAG